MQQIIAIIIGLGLLILLWRQWRSAEKKLAAQPQKLFAEVQSLFENSQIEQGETIGTWKLTGTYGGRVFQLKAIADTLATRKLPSLWLMVTLPEPQPVKATLDLMMRPSGPSSFSNFDFLPYTLKTPKNFPEHAVIRTDDQELTPPPDILRFALTLFETRYGKELLISPKGLRIVVHVAEVDRLRYGVFREANFGGTVIQPDLLIHCLDTLLKLNSALEKNV